MVSQPSMPSSPLPIPSPGRILSDYRPTSAEIDARAAEMGGSNLRPVQATPFAGRYAQVGSQIAAYVCEAQLARMRAIVEAEWFSALCTGVLADDVLTGTTDILPDIVKRMRTFADSMSLAVSARISEVEKQTNHDVIAMITVLRENLAKEFDGKISSEKLSQILSLVHLSLTSEDVTSPSQGLMLVNTIRKVLAPEFNGLVSAIRSKSQEWMDVPDPANAVTSLGQRYEQYAERLERAGEKVFSADYFTVKFSGATGTLAALKLVAKDGSDPIQVAEKFIRAIAPELRYLRVTGQINPHDDIAVWCGYVAALCDEILVIGEEIWEDTGRDVLTGEELQKLLFVSPKPGASGSSAMPQKVQVINIENALGCAKLLRSLANGFAETINVNRLQRELSDSRMMRELFGNVLPMLLQMTRSFGSDVPKLTLNESCRKAGFEGPELERDSVENKTDAKRQLRSNLFGLEEIFKSAADAAADVAFLARTHNQPASPTTFGQALRVFGERLQYLGELYDRHVLHGHESGAQIEKAARGVLTHFLGDLRIYLTHRNGELAPTKDGESLLAGLTRDRFDTLAAECLGSSGKLQDLFAAFDVYPIAMRRELEAHYESLGEAVQTVLRRFGVWDAYEIVKKVTRGAQMNKAQYGTMIGELLADDRVKTKVPEAVKSWLRELTPDQFVGEAARLARLP